MKKEDLINALEKLEETYHKEDGYDVKTILGLLNIDCNKKTEKQTRKTLRSLISKKIYHEFKTAGNEDIVYCPKGKGSGQYRLSQYR